MVHGLAASVSAESLLEMQILQPLLTQHFWSGTPRIDFNKLSKCFLCTLKFEKHCSRASYPEVCFLWVFNRCRAQNGSSCCQMNLENVGLNKVKLFIFLWGGLPDSAELLICYSTTQKSPLYFQHT